MAKLAETQLRHGKPDVIKLCIARKL